MSAYAPWRVKPQLVSGSRLGTCLAARVAATPVGRFSRHIAGSALTGRRTGTSWVMRRAASSTAVIATRGPCWERPSGVPAPCAHRAQRYARGARRGRLGLPLAFAPRRNRPGAAGRVRVTRHPNVPPRGVRGAPLVGESFIDRGDVQRVGRLDPRKSRLRGTHWEGSGTS